MTGAELRRWRARNKISQPKLGKMIGLQERRIRQLEREWTDRELPIYVTLAVAAWSLGVRSYDGSEIMLLRPVAEPALSFRAKPDFSNPTLSLGTAFEKHRAAALDPKR